MPARPHEIREFADLHERRTAPVCLPARSRGEIMISLKKYLDGEFQLPDDRDADGILPATLAAYGAAMLAVGNCSLDACPGVGMDLKNRLVGLEETLSPLMSVPEIESTAVALQSHLSHWAQRTARHYRDKAAEVRDILLTMTRAGEAVGRRDRRCADQMSAVTACLSRIATLEDISAIRASIEKGAADLKGAIEHMTAEGKAAQEQLKKQVAAYQTRLEEAEELASRDALTGLRNRLCVESMIEERIGSGAVFCVAMIDLNGFKKVNDTHGHLAGDELLRQFAVELRSACRSTDIIGRWGGDEFLIVLEGDIGGATDQIDRLRQWVCGDYTVRGKAGTAKLRLEASIGLAEHLPQEPIQALMDRADAAMYRDKQPGRGGEAA